MRESTVEKRLVQGVERRGGVAVKLDPRGYVGIPDRLVIGPRLVAFVELKRPRGGVVSKKQQRWHDRIAAWGLPVVVLSTVEEVDEWVNTSFG